MPNTQPNRFAAAIASLRPNPRTNPLLGPVAIWRVARHDLFGTKDVQDSPTLSYVWLADQFGHFAIGFAGTLAGGGLIAGNFGYPLVRSAISVGLALAAWFVWKEWRDFRAERSHAWPASSPRPVPFAFNSGEILHNCLCACFYTFCGIVIAVLGAWRWWAGLAMFVVLLIVAGRVASWWLQRKVAFQQADLPYLYRLANFPEKFSDARDEEVIQELVCDPSPATRHVLISGPLGSGKTCLAVGIGTEYAFRLGIARFTSVIKLSQTGVAIAGNQGLQPRRGRSFNAAPSTTADTTFQDGRELWPFDRAELLIVDDLDGGITGPGPIGPAVMLRALQAAPGGAFFARMADRRTVWVAGTTDNAAAWRDVVAKLVANGDTSAVALVCLR